MSDDPASAEAFRWELEQAIERLKKTRDALTEERDEARRMVCVTLYTDKEMQRNHARLCGWDCFKENA